MLLTDYKIYPWEKHGDLYIRGSYMLGDESLSLEERELERNLLGARAKDKEEFIDQLKKLESFEDFKKVLSNISGSFAVILDKGDQIFAAVDNIRSFPIFYNSKSMQVSDRAKTLVDQALNENNLDEIAQAEFKLAGVTFNNRTLFKDVKGLEAGQALLIDKKNNKAKVDNYIAFSYKSDKYSLSIEEKKKMIRTAYRIAAKRLMDFAKDSTIVIPLSAGQDSRLVALYLHDLGAKNVICYSYGRRGNFEQEASQKIADFLGYKWIFAPFDDINWREWGQSQEFRDFVNFSSNMVSVPHFQDYHAVKYFKENNLVPEDAVFCPGHSGDYIHGNHIPHCFIENEGLKKKDIINEILKEITTNINPDLTKEQNEKVEKDISIVLDKFDLKGKRALINAFERFDLMTKQTKLIGNSSKMYEFLGYRWYFMIWDRTLFEAWSSIEPELRYNRNMHYKMTVEDQKALRERISETKTTYPDKGLKNLIKDTVRLYLPKSYRRTVFSSKNKNTMASFDTHIMNWNKIFTREEFDKYAERSADFNGMISFTILDILKNS